MNTAVVRTFDRSYEANIILGKLQNEGVECFLLDENTVTVMPVWGIAVGGIKLAVAEEDVSKANELLKQFDQEYMESAQCPKCGKHDIQLVSKSDSKNIVTAILTWLFSNYAVSATNVYQCQFCKYESETLPSSPEDFN